MRDKGCARINIFKCNYDEEVPVKGCLEHIRSNLGPSDLKHHMKSQLKERSSNFLRLMTKKMVTYGATDLMQIQVEVLNMQNKFFKDAYILKYTDKTSKIMSWSAIEQEWNLKPSDLYFQTIESVTMTPSSKIGVGESIIYHFVVNSEKDFTGNVAYDFK